MAKLRQPFTAKNLVMFIWENEMQSEMCVVLGQCWVGDGMGRWIAAKVFFVCVCWFMFLVFFMHACVVLN